MAADFFNGSLQNAVGKAAPASVHSSNNAAAAVSNKDGQTVCRHHAGHNPARRSPLRVGFGRRLRRINIVGAEHCRAVNLSEPLWFARTALRHNRTIHHHAGLNVARMEREIESHDAVRAAVRAA